MDSDRPDMAMKQRITVFQTHEVAHMWSVNPFVMVLYNAQTSLEVWKHRHDGVVGLLVSERRLCHLGMCSLLSFRDYLHTMKMGEVIIVGTS